MRNGRTAIRSPKHGSSAADIASSKVGDTDAEWQKKKDPLEMYVMLGAYDRNTNYWRPSRPKGHEPWTGTSTADKARRGTEVHRHRPDESQNRAAVFARALPERSKYGTTTFAQAVFYNANEQKPDAKGAVTPTQAKVGWDTLNWDPSTSVPEWGNKIANSDAKWPWADF